MQLKLVFFAVLAVAQLLTQAASGELTSTQKQILLDLKNSYRARNGQVAVRLLEWSSVLEDKAQDYVESCDAVSPPPGFLQFYNTSGPLPENNLLRFSQIFDEWEGKEEDRQQLLSRRSTHLGCAQFFCERLPISVSTKTQSAMFTACAYNPRFFDEKPNSKAICTEKGGASNCPSDAQSCVSFPESRAGQINADTQTIPPICSPTDSYPQVPPDPDPTPPPTVTRRVTGITPSRYGSIAGGQEIRLLGQGFSPSNFDGANEVFFVRGTERIPCDVNYYSTSSTSIVCVTRASSIRTGQATYSIEVYVTIDGVRIQVTDICWWCTYVYHYYSRTPLIQNLEPNVATFGETVTIEGKLYADSFADVADSESDESGFDRFTRILVGGLLCDHMPSNDTEYEATIDEAGLYGRIECLPMTEYNVGSMNVTLFTKDRGASFFEERYFQTSYDNKFQPYTFKTHADILEVSPRSGSRAGGTRISITLNTPLVNYTDLDNIQVKVGGVSCEGVSLVESRGNHSVIQCTTGPQPSPSTYYPGGRGFLREVWDNGQPTPSITAIRAYPRTEKAAPHDKAFLHSNFVSDFGELYYIGHRLTGFFVPPVTSLYTFGIRSDDASAFFLSSSVEDILENEIATARAYSRNSWTYYPEQTSEPMLLEAGKYYYFMMAANQGVGPWEVGISAKVHNLSYNSYPYVGDNEEQVVAITSTVVKEEHAINLEARPVVQTITITDTNSPSDNSTVSCLIPLALSSVNLTINRDMLPEALEALLNGQPITQSVGEVRVFKDYGGAPDVKFTIVFLTSAEVEMIDIPQLSLRAESGAINCDFTNADTNATNEDYTVTVAVETTQSLSYPSNFSVGFALPAQPPRFTPSLPLSATESQVNSEISDLFAWSCESDVESLTESDRVLYRSDLEDSNEGNRVNVTSFCGHYSEQNPRTVWRSSWFNNVPINPNRHRYMCFAYRGNLPSFRVTTSFIKVITEQQEGNSVPVQFADQQNNINTRISDCSSYPFSGSVQFDSDGWSDYRCVNVRDCLLELHPDSRDHMISIVQFGGSGSFWVDEFVVANSEVSFTRTGQPVAPNGVSVNYVQVSGGTLSMPLLRDSADSAGNNSMDSEPDFRMIVSTFHVSYTVRECGNGIVPLVGYYGNEEPVRIEQTAVGSPPVSGTFDLRIGDQYIRDIPSDIERGTLEMLLEANLKDQGGFLVERSGSCEGHSWEIQWETKGGDMPEIVADAGKLTGVEPVITVTTLVDGGTWLRPISGDMLRLPMEEPQVEVILEGTPSSCRGQVCSFSYDDSATPTIETIYPLEGQGGDEVTIYGIGFTNDTSSITVAIGNAPCNLVSANSSQITCILSNHPAGYYDISVLIEGMGVAITSNATCFHYLLTVESVSPMAGGVGGGVPIEISGNGFLDFTPTSADGLEYPFSSLPWFQFGLGLPTFEMLRMCPSYRELLSLLDSYTTDSVTEIMGRVDELAERWMEQNNETMDGPFQPPQELSECINSNETCEFAGFQIFQKGRFLVGNFIVHLLNLYYHFPSHVFVGGTPCIITESTVTQLTCVPVLSLPTEASITVTVFKETASLDNAYDITLADSPLISSVNPSQGAVTGQMLLTISGTNFGVVSSAEVTVVIGASECEVQSANDTMIECTTSSSRPSYQPVLVSTPNGVAVSESAFEDMGSGESESGSGMGRDSSLFPIFEYKLVVYVDGTIASTGSVFGGTAVTIEGGVFAPNYTQVLVGGREVKVQDVSTDTITFQTPSSTATHNVMLERSPFRVTSGTQGLTVDLYWSEADLKVQVGDTIVWRLSDGVQDFSGLQFVELSLESESDTVTKILTPGSDDSVFSYTFNRIGDYALSSVATPVFDIQTFYFNVTGPRPSVDGIEVLVGGHKALVVNRDMPPVGVSKRQAGVCNDPIPETDGELVIQYSPCLTPTVTSVEPRMGFRLETTFTIRGSQFSTSPEMNEVSFGGHSCTPFFSNETTIQCTMDASSGMAPTFVNLPVLVRVVDLGNAYVVSEEVSSIVLQSYISQIDPRYGSLEGGTDLIIYGDGFPVDESAIVSVLLGNDYPCTVTSSCYTEVRCTTHVERNTLDADQEVLLMISTTSDLYGTQASVCLSSGGCNFTYSDAYTPKVDSVSPTSIDSTDSTLITISGTGLGNGSSSNVVQFGGASCQVTGGSDTSLTCLLSPLPATSYPLSLRVCDLPDDRCYGYARILSLPNTTITSVPDVISVSPESGSVQGGTEITITGRGFNSNLDDVQVLIGDSECDVLGVNYSTITCLTSANSAGMYSVMVSITDLASFPASVQYNYSMETTPTISDITPGSGKAGDTITLSGSGLDTGSEITGDSTVFFEEAECQITSISESTITCTLENYFVGTYVPEVNIDGIGTAMIDPNVTFTFTLNVDSVQPSEGSFAGSSPISISGSGFFPADIEITVCGEPCPLSTKIPSADRVECILPSMDSNTLTGSSVMSCDIAITTKDELVTFLGGYTFSEVLTPRVTGVNRTRGGTAGGSGLLITGQGFSNTATVTIAGSVCEVESQSPTEIVCTTGASGRNVRAVIMVDIEGMGFALSTTTFWYVDLWSSPFTWQGGIIPTAGDFVVVPRGQTLVLDVVTPVLGYILIQGGTLIFDPEKGDNEVELHTQGGLITSDGVFQVGTEDEPFLAKTQIVLYGHVLSTEIPVYGAKTLALRRGTLDIHGRTLNETWTKLSQTVPAGSVELYLQKYVDWEVGGSIVIASTSFSQRENEERVIESIAAGPQGSILTLTEPLDFEHISVQQTIAGRFIDTSAEVGYLTRNVVIRGNVNEEWLEDVPDCPEEFRPGQFETQTCFLGRFGAETISDQFGSQVMIHAAEQNQGHVTARFGYVEVTHAGQAFRLGRYPIHYHLNGNVSGSYVRGCGIHHTFNRAVTMHAVDYLLVEKNVAFNILGHAYFLEDGIEQHNIIQDNLGIFVRASSSLLNVDITPATFWVVNPNNIVRRNAAAGGTHFGFWYRLPQHPEGPSATNSICPRHLPLEEFSDNTAHSFGWYGLWVFRQYHPSRTGSCNDFEPVPVYYDRFLAWRCDKGIEFEQVGSLQIRDSILMDNKFSGVEITDVRSIWSGEDDDGPLVKDSLIVGYSEVSNGFSTCTDAGVKTPHSYYLTVSNVTFANFDQPNCYPVQACSFCRSPFQGGFETRFKQISYMNAGDDIMRWQWFHEHVQRDLDGTLSRTGVPSVLVPSSNLYPPSLCEVHPPSSSGPSGGMICNASIEFGRIGIHDPRPNSLTTTDLELSSDHGADQLPFEFKRFRGGPGQIAIVPLNETYQLTWLEGVNFTNITYSIVTAGFAEEDYILFRQKYPRTLDFTSIRGVTTAVNVSVLEDSSTAQTGDWALLDNTTLLYIIKGTDRLDADESITFSTYRCFYENCIPPPPPTRPPLPTIPPPRPEGRPEVTQSWSNSSIWPNNQKPQAGDNVYINSSMYVIIDEPLPRLGTLFIAGGLELEDTIDHEIEADFVIVDGGRLAIGYPETPFLHQAKIMLHGDISSTEIGNRVKRNFATNVGAKALAVFGDLIIHGVTRTPTWTTLATTVAAGSNVLQLTDPVTWIAGDRIVVTSTSYDAYETEVFEITNVISPTSIELSGSLSYTHSGGYSNSLGEDNRYTTRAEVGLLTRNIVITNDDNARAESEAFGCRVVVGQNEDFTAKAQIEGVEFSGCGQLGYTEEFDPRFALAILNIDDDAYVRDCSMHDGYNTGIGVFDGRQANVSGNVVHNTVGPSVIATGSGHTINDNLASLSRFIGTFRRQDDQNTMWTANFEVTDVSGLTLIGNAAAGGAKAGFHTNGEECTESSTTLIRDNTAHSSLHGVHLGYFTNDGNPSGCSRFSHFNIFNCYHFGIFSYTTSGVQVFDSVFTNNKAAVLVAVMGPPSLSHIRGTKSVVFERVLIISASEEFTCDEDNKRPAIADHPLSHAGLRSKTGGHVGLVIPSFVSGPGHFPKAVWWSIITYPAISGLTEVKQVTFANFHSRCDKMDTVLRTSPQSEDAVHPVHLSDITFISDSRFDSPITPDAKLFVDMPHLGSVNPSDCVDMDCDGFKQVLLNDIGGTFTEAGSDRTLVSMAEFEWDGDRRRGLGDYRIPRTMLSLPNGSRIDVDNIYPSKGIVRSTQSFAEDDCTFNSVWNMYTCSGIEHLMLVLESLDADTEVRRLSPIGIGANGFINLLNGPQDHGWCGGYTCQERISLFFGIVATGLQYTVALTSTNPQNFALYLLHARETQSIVTCLIYTNPQRLDVYHNGVYVVPKNAEIEEDGNLRYIQGDRDQFLPLVTDEPGANFYDRSTKQLCITLKGDGTYRIETTPVVVLSLDVQVTVDTFFDEATIVRNIALLLEIPESKIRIVSISRETTSRRRKRAEDTGVVTETIEFEFGDPPQEMIEDTPTEVVNMTDSGMNTTEPGMNMTDTGTGQNGTTGDDGLLSFDELEDLSERVVTIVQTGEIVQALNTSANITSASIDEPAPPPMDETGGVRATPDTGGPQPEDFVNSTDAPMTFSEIQRLEDEAEQNKTDEIVFSIPTSLRIDYEPEATDRIVEGLPIGEYAPVITMLDNNGEVVLNLGLDIPWILTAEIAASPNGGFAVEASANFTMGRAVLSSLVFSHPGEYVLSYRVSYPTTAEFGISSSQTISVVPRGLSLEVSQQPGSGNTTFILFPYPSVSLVDENTGVVIQDHSWRNSTWVVIATVRTAPEMTRISSYEVELTNGRATFPEVKIDYVGDYEILFEAYTRPSAIAAHLPASVSSNQFSIEQLQLTKLDIIYDVDFNSTIGDLEQDFIDAFTAKFLSIYPNVEIVNVTLTEGSIIVGVIFTAVNPQQLISLIYQATTLSNIQDLTFNFNGTILTPSNITHDSAFPVVIPTLPPSILEKHFVLIMATVIPGFVLIVSLLFLIVVCCVVCRHKKNRKLLDLKSKNKVQDLETEERYIVGPPRATSPAASSVDEYFLLPDSNLKDVDTRSFDSHELDSLASTPASQRKADVIVSEKVDVKVRAKPVKMSETFFSNPVAEEALKDEEKLEKLDTDFGTSTFFGNGNTNNNNNLDINQSRPSTSKSVSSQASIQSSKPLPKGVSPMEAALYHPPNVVPDIAGKGDFFQDKSGPSTAGSVQNARMNCNDMVVEDLTN